jgi:predicted Zn-dependent peptidase
MGWLLPALTDAKIQNQKDVVRNERRQRYDNAPYGQVPMWLREALYPEGHPYRIPTIGLHEDIEAATPEDVKAFFQKWYTPNNAWLAIVGDIDPTQTRQLVTRYFGDIPRGPDAHPILEAKASLSEEKIVRKPSKVPLDKVWIAWLSPAIYADGDAALDVASAILSDGKDSPLYKRLVRDKKVATDVTAYQASARLDSNFTIEATAAPGHNTDEVVAEVDKVLAEFLKAPPTTEQVTVARLRIERSFFEGLQSIAAKANQLNGYAYVTGDPGFIGKDLARYRALTPEAVGAAAKTWIGGKNRVVLHVFPEATGGRCEMIALLVLACGPKSTAPAETATATEDFRSTQPAPLPGRTVRHPDPGEGDTLERDPGGRRGEPRDAARVRAHRVPRGRGERSSPRSRVRDARHDERRRCRDVGGAVERSDEEAGHQSRRVGWDGLVRRRHVVSEGEPGAEPRSHGRRREAADVPEERVGDRRATASPGRRERSRQSEQRRGSRVRRRHLVGRLHREPSERERHRDDDGRRHEEVVRPLPHAAERPPSRRR